MKDPIANGDIDVDPGFINDLQKFVEAHPTNPLALVSKEDLEEGPLNAIGAIVMTAAFQEMERVDERERAARPIPTAPQLKAEQEHREKEYKRWNETDRVTRQVGFKQHFDIAEKWANKFGLTDGERCHGVVWESYQLRGDTETLHPVTGKPTPVSYAAEYASAFDVAKANDIKSELIKSAAILFN